MKEPLCVELPYRKDSAALFENLADRPWSVFLDGGGYFPLRTRYDILSAEPYATLVTRGGMTEMRGELSTLSPDDPFALLHRQLQVDLNFASDLPFVGGAIGYFGYDLARRYERLPQHSLDDIRMPTMVIGFYDWAVVVDHGESRSWLVTQNRHPSTRRRWDALIAQFSNPVRERPRPAFEVAGLASNLSRIGYATAFRRALAYIEAGDCYQINLAQRFNAPIQGDPWLAYQAVRALNRAPYGAYLNTPYGQILSASPERFLKVTHGAVETCPIKGTRARAGHPRLDAEIALELQRSEKDRAENLMIVDLLRNDLSKNCALGSVEVSRLFEVESFATVHHLVSTVVGRLDVNRTAIDLLQGCFPGGSVTGAPKLRAMQIIEELEPHRRGVYCGAIGYLGCDGQMDTSIAIRTLVCSGGSVYFSAGGGIVADSKLEDEYQETFDKAAAMLRLMQSWTTSNAGH